MRIIAGKLGGRLFQSPGSFKTHPMSDKIRGALFSMLGDIEGLRVLDAFAGSGALSFEAASRGASLVLAIDSDLAAQKTIQKNIAALRLERQVKLVRASANAWLQTTTPQSDSFDVVLLDPPYGDLQPNLVQRLTERLAPGGTLVLSWPADQALPELSQLSLVVHKTYGDAQLGFYQTK